MKRLGYFEKLSLAARWFLPGEEAESVIEDYRDILSEAGGGKEARERLGPPLKVVLSAADRGKAITWNLFFAAALAFHFLFIYWVRHYSYNSLAVLTISAVIITLLLRLLEVGKLHNPFKGLSWHLLVLCILLILALIAIHTPIYYFLSIFDKPGQWGRMGRFQLLLYGCVIFFSILSLLSIVLARMKDRRWRAVSILSLTLVCVAFYFMSVFGNMDPSCDPVVDVVLLHHEGIAVAAAGLFAAGVGLC